jgi:hypothetical protein
MYAGVCQGACLRMAGRKGKTVQHQSHCAGNAAPFKFRVAQFHFAPDSSLITAGQLSNEMLPSS